MKGKTKVKKSLFRTVTVEGEDWQLKIPVAIKCFDCGDEIRQDERFIYSRLRARFKRAGTRFKDRAFHLACYHEFLAQTGPEDL